MRWLVRRVGFCYWLLLTVLLLVPDPAGVVGLQSVPIFAWGDFGIHLAAFLMLGVLVQATRWPKRMSGSLIVVLVLYGIATECLQLFVPPRTADIADGIEDVLGIVLGSGVYWLIRRAVQRFAKSDRAAELVNRAPQADASAP